MFDSAKARRLILACAAEAAEQPRAGLGPCSFPHCTGGGGFRPCGGFTGTSDSCLNCGHAYSYHA